MYQMMNGSRGTRTLQGFFPRTWFLVHNLLLGDPPQPQDLELSSSWRWLLTVGLTSCLLTSNWTFLPVSYWILKFTHLINQFTSPHPLSLTYLFLSIRMQLRHSGSSPQSPTWDSPILYPPYPFSGPINFKSFTSAIFFSVIYITGPPLAIPDPSGLRSATCSLMSLLELALVPLNFLVWIQFVFLLSNFLSKRSSSYVTCWKIINASYCLQDKSKSLTLLFNPIHNRTPVHPCSLICYHFPEGKNRNRLAYLRFIHAITLTWTSSLAALFLLKVYSSVANICLFIGLLAGQHLFQF